MPAPALGCERRVTAAAHAAAQDEIEVREGDATALPRPDRPERDDRVERLVAVHLDIVLPGVCHAVPPNG